MEDQNSSERNRNLRRYSRFCQIGPGTSLPFTSSEMIWVRCECGASSCRRLFDTERPQSLCNAYFRGMQKCINTGEIFIYP
nr:MAG TPA: Histone-lysine N-methyltransferase [Caudoviricetes sp.]